MCAICGVVNFRNGELVEHADIEKMTQTLAHRGPDDDGYFIEGGVGLGFRRLSIIDLAGGHQPIFNEDESAAVVFNGEIYNYRELAEGLTGAGHTFKTRSDTETILHAYEQYGDDCVDHLRGMFAFAIWDRRRQRLLVARDRLGVKPLYYYVNGDFLAFASEVKALLELPRVPREVDPEAFDLYLSLRYVPGPRTMFKNIFRLQPGHTLVASAAGIHIRKYWDIAYPDRASDSKRESLDQFRELLEESVRMRLISEVPLGVLLSGGIDSSAILATMSKVAAGGAPIQTFSVGYDASEAATGDSNEFEYARLAANAFSTDHHEYRLTARQFEESIPRLVWHLDEPLADPACIPLYFVSKAAREHVTVVLSGEGADEILAGYGIYSRMLAMENMPHWLGPALAHITPHEKLRNYLRMSGQPLESRYRGICRGFRVEGMRRLVGEGRVEQSTQQLGELFGSYFGTVNRASPLNRMLYADTKVWLADDLLVKADKMTMATGLELRVPFLDHRLVEFAATLQDSSKLNGKTGKALLRTAMRGILPDAIIDRPKKGFPVPLASWLRGPLKQFTQDHLLDPQSACARFADQHEIARIVEQHSTGRADRSQEIWTLLVFEHWHRQFIENRVEKRQAA
jgi:asparagine synthase (glutamine-hydrolysing)